VAHGVAGEQHTRLWQVDRDASIGVTWGRDHARTAAEPDEITILEFAIDPSGRRRRQLSALMLRCRSRFTLSQIRE
jgi:ribosomal protein S18 acetylase RimI-like enzyme